MWGHLIFMYEAQNQTIQSQTKACIRKFYVQATERTEHD